MNKKGFTLIELLIVIAIIGILSSIVLVMLGNSRNKANDAKVRAQLVSLRTGAELYYDSTGGNTYGLAVSGTEAAGSTLGPGCNSNMFADPSIAKHVQSADYPISSGTGKCTSTGSAYAVSSRLTAAGTFWCVDSTGATHETNVLQADNVALCP